jgi:hypothetical protein
MKAVRLTAGILYHLSRFLSVLILLIVGYATAIILIYQVYPSATLPFRVLENNSFRLLLPFTQTPFLLGDYTVAYLVSYLSTMAFYGLFLWMLSDVFKTFRQPKLFTPKGVLRLSRFYILNLVVPFVFLLLLLWFGQEIIDIVRIILLHLVIGVFAFFMAAIFRQGLILQEEQDLTF